jgi:hypothetical protein
MQRAECIVLLGSSFSNCAAWPSNELLQQRTHSQLWRCAHSARTAHASFVGSAVCRGIHAGSAWDAAAGIMQWL